MKNRAVAKNKNANFALLLKGKTKLEGVRIMGNEDFANCKSPNFALLPNKQKEGVKNEI